MNLRRLSFGFVSLALLTGLGAWALVPQSHRAAPALGAGNINGPEGDDETEIKLVESPAGVQAALSKLTAAANVKKVVKETDEGITTFEVEFTDNGVGCSATFSAAGDVMELERGTTEAKIPAAALTALKKEYPKATFADPVIVTKMYYEVHVVLDGQKHEVKCDAAGNIEDEPKEGGEDHEHAKGQGHEDRKHEGKKGEKDDDKD